MSDLENTLALLNVWVISFRGWGFVLLLVDGLFEVSGVKAYAEGSIGLLEVCQGGTPIPLGL